MVADIPIDATVGVVIVVGLFLNEHMALLLDGLRQDPLTDVDEPSIGRH